MEVTVNWKALSWVHTHLTTHSAKTNRKTETAVNFVKPNQKPHIFFLQNQTENRTIVVFCQPHPLVLLVEGTSVLLSDSGYSVLKRMCVCAVSKSPCKGRKLYDFHDRLSVLCRWDKSPYCLYRTLTTLTTRSQQTWFGSSHGLRRTPLSSTCFVSVTLLCFFASSTFTVRWCRRPEVFMSSVRVCACVYSCGMLFLRYLWYTLMDFCQTFVNIASLAKGELITFWG